MKPKSMDDKKTQSTEAEDFVLPEHVRILSANWRVRQKHGHEMSELGLCHCDIREIWLNAGNLPEVNRNTFLHELLHALSYTAQLEMTERQVDVLATMLISLCRENPQLVDYFFREESE